MSELKFLFENLPAMCKELDAARTTIAQLQVRNQEMERLLLDIGKYLKASGTRFSFQENEFYGRINAALAHKPSPGDEK